MDRLATRTPSAPERSLLLSQLPFYALLLATLGIVAAAWIPGSGLGPFYLRRQDQWLLIFGAIALLCCVRDLPDRSASLAATWRLALAVGGVMALGTLAGHYGILSGYDLSLDERLANFDAAIFARGHVVAPLPMQWQAHSDALNTMFMYRADPREAWASNYLPGHAALRALIGLLGTRSLTGPLMTLAGALGLWACTRRIWPANREAPVIAVLLYAGAGQIWLNGMTAYAMPAHLAVNLAWLWLVLRRIWWADAGALMLGFLAVGLHQLHYHPLFAAPILFLLILERDWRRVAFYVIGYLAIALFWEWWHYWSSTLVAGGPLMADAARTDYLSRIITNLDRIDGLRLSNMTANLLRMIAWQHLLLLPLVVLGIRAARRDRLAAALLGGIVLTLLVRIAFQPYQGHGLGYRSIHGLIGNFILLAVFGWVSLGDDVGRWRSLLLRTTTASCFIILPLQAWMAHDFYASYAKVSDRMDTVSADYVVVGASDTHFSSDLVRNDPFLTNHPIRLLREALDPGLQERLCATHPSVALVGPATLKPVSDYFGVMISPSLDGENLRLAGNLRRMGCHVELL